MLIGSKVPAKGFRPYKKHQKVALPAKKSPIVHLLTQDLHKTYSLASKRSQSSTSVLAEPSKRNKVTNDFDDDNGDYIIREGEVLVNGKNRYIVEKMVGKGSFGQVVRVLLQGTNQRFAIKIIKNSPNFTLQAIQEIKLLKYLGNQNEEYGHQLVVEFYGSFTHHNHTCLIFELLSFDLYEVLGKCGFVGLSMSVVRKFTLQLLQGLEFLSHPNIRMIHCDLKPENILLKDPKKSLLKLIDFGSSCFSNEASFTYIQSRYYRAPEVIMGHKYSLPIDMWSLGCILIEMVIGVPLFNGATEHDQLCRICDVLGLPPLSFMLKTPKNKLAKFFVKVRPSEYRILQYKNFQPTNMTIESIVMRKRSANTNITEEFRLIDLATKMLRFNPEDRITPSEALEHVFFTMNEQSANTILSKHP